MAYLTTENLHKTLLKISEVEELLHRTESEISARQKQFFDDLARRIQSVQNEVRELNKSVTTIIEKQNAAQKVLKSD